VGIFSWAVSTADAVSRVGDGVACAEDLGQRASRGVRGTARGLTGLHRIGVAERARVVVGGDLLHHSDDDRERALAIVDLGLARLRAEVEPIVTAADAPPARAQWWSADVLPMLSDWALFREHQASWMNRLATDWETYLAWRKLLGGLRTGARMQGIALTSPEPERLPETILERGLAGRGSKIEAAWTIGRTLLYTAAGVAGIWGLYAVARDVRRGTEEDPHDKI
jgi:hypothetical protein